MNVPDFTRENLYLAVASLMLENTLKSMRVVFPELDSISHLRKVRDVVEEALDHQALTDDKRRTFECVMLLVDQRLPRRGSS